MCAKIFPNWKIKSAKIVKLVNLVRLVRLAERCPNVVQKFTRTEERRSMCSADELALALFERAVRTSALLSSR